MDKAYDHKLFEGKIYRQWEESGGFRPEVNAGGEPYTIIMPPPNANDPLHVGHAMFVSLEDAMIRFNRMRGKAALWVPGTDHAGIETQYVFEKKLAKDGKSRFDFDRQTLYQKIWDYVQENSGISVEQMKRLGASADWSRFTFTLDAKVVDLVLETFKKLHDDGLVYRDVRLVNYCTKCGTSYSDLEIEYEDRTSPIFYVKYYLAEFKDQSSKIKVTDQNSKFEEMGAKIDAEGKAYISVATVRPEPIFADTHLAVNPKDPQRRKLIGKRVLNPLSDEEMEIIGDEFVDPEFGTGIVKLTPAHDHGDFEVAKKHGLPMRQAISTDGRLTDLAGKFTGMKVNAAREAVVKELQEKGLIERIDDKYQNRVAVCYKTKDTIEPLPLSQFFIKVEPLARKALEALDSGVTKIHGAGREKILRHWLENLRDWNITRQIVWGIRMPVWYEIGEKNTNLIVGFLNKEGKFTKGKIGELLKEYSFEELEQGLQTLEAPQETTYVISNEKPGEGFLQATETFDTWFSSGQWPVVTLKTTQAGDFEKYYPTAVMETGYDILTFWVMRMMLLGIYETGKSPFQHVYLHGLVRDDKGQKMSKSKGNVINPIEVADKYGADALRMALMMGSTPGQDSSVGDGKIRGMRNLSNKIWNAARFVRMIRENPDASGNSDQHTPLSRAEVPSPEGNDKKFYEKLDCVVKDVTMLMEEMKLGLAAETVHNEFWHWYCDVCIEEGKRGKLPPAALEEGLKVFLKLMHPFMPFVTEAVWGELGYEGQLMIERWPETEN